MSPLDYERLKEQLKRHEGIRLYPYVDTAGKLTIGVGRNLTDRGVTPATVEQMLNEDVAICVSELLKQPWYGALSNVRQRVIINMAFNMGVPRLLEFRKMIVAIIAKDFEGAAYEILDSETGRREALRANELANMMRSGNDV